MPSRLDRLLEAEKTGVLLPADKTLLDQARARGLIPDVTSRPAWKEYMAGVNEGIAGTVGAPVDIVNFGLSAIGADSSKPFAGSGWMKELMENTLGPIASPQDPEDALPTAGRAFGANVAMLPALGVGAVAGMGKRALAPLFEPFRRMPMRAALMDIGISVPSGFGEYFGREAGEAIHPSLGPTGQMIGGATGGVVAPLAMGQTVRGAKAIGRGFMPGQEHGERIAGKMIRGSMADPFSEQRLLNPDIPWGQVTTGQFIDDPGVIALERTVARGPGAAAGRSQIRLAEHDESLRAGIHTAVGAVEPKTQNQAVSFLQARTNQAVARIEQRLRNAIANIRSKTAALGEAAPIDEIQKTARAEIDRALSLGRAEEHRVWQAIGPGKYDMTAIKEEARNIIDTTTKIEGASVNNAIIYKIAGNVDEASFTANVYDEMGELVATKQLSEGVIGDIDSIETVMALRKRLLDIIRAENSRGAWARAERVRRLLDATTGITPIDAMSAESLGQLAAARKFSKSFNDTFTRGPLGKILGYDTAGDVRIPPEMTYERLLGAGTSGQSGVRAVRQAAAFDPENAAVSVARFDTNMSKYLKAKFAAVAINPVTGEFSPAAASSFIKQYGPTLDEFTALRDAMIDATGAEQLARSVSTSARTRARRITAMSRAALYTRGEPAAQMVSVLNSNNPVTAARMIMHAAAKDKTGVATLGVRSALYEAMMERIAPDTSNTLDVAGGTLIQAKKLRGFLKAYKPVIQEVYGLDTVKVLEQVSLGADIGARIGLGVAAGRGSDTAQNIRMLPESLGVLLGTKMSFGMHTLMAARLGRKLLGSFWDAFSTLAPETINATLENALYNKDYASQILAFKSGSSPGAAQRLFGMAARASAITVGGHALGLGEPGQQLAPPVTTGFGNVGVPIR